MKDILARTLVLLAATCGLNAFAATPVAVWEDMAHLTSGEYAWTADASCTTGEDGAITIGENGGLTLTLDSGSIHTGRTLTLIVDAEVPAFGSECPLIDLNIIDTTKSPVQNNCVTLTSSGTTLRQRWNYGGDTYGSATWTPTARQKIALVFKGVSDVSDRGTATYLDSALTIPLVNKLMTGAGKMTAIRLGCYAKDGAKVAAGMKIHRVALFGTNLSADAIANYHFPPKIGETVKGVRWGTLGDTDLAVATSQDGAFGWNQWALNFSADDNIANTGVGKVGTVNVRSMLLMKRENGANVPTSVTLMQGGTVLTSSSATTESNVKIYKTDGSVLATREGVRYAFDGEAPLWADENVTLVLNGGNGMSVVKPCNGLLRHDDWAPALEFTCDFTRTRHGRPEPMMFFVTGGVTRDVLNELMPRPRSVEPRADAPVTIAPPAGVTGYYELRVRDGVPTIAGDDEGRRYAQVTFDQLKALGEGAKVPDCTIVDWPEFKYRGLLLDCGRNFQDLDSIRDTIDHLAAYKMNVFHWHITDDPGWRLESKAHPELQKDAAFTRQVGQYYTQQEFKDIVAYAKARGVTVIPELDMPGHTAAFRRGTGISDLATEQGKLVLGELIDELCSLASAEDMPIIHLGTDEARASGETVPQTHLDYWAGKVTGNGRILMGWSPGLKLPGQGIKHLWQGATDPRGDTTPYIDSQNSYYINHVDPEELLSVAAYQQPCRWGEKSEKLGAIIGVWHDDRIAQTEDVARMNAVYPAVVLLSDNFWRGRETDEPTLYARIPSPSDARFALAADLERRTLAQRDRVLKDLKHPFPYVAQTQMRWRMTDADANSVIATDIAQATTYPQHFWFPASKFVDKTSGNIVMETWIDAPRTIDCGAWIGMTGFSRSDGRKRDAPTPAIGQWNRHGATIAVNGVAIAPPEWTHPAQTGDPKETPLVDEDYHYRAPSRITLRKGVNHVKLTLPKSGGWKWIGTFTPINGTSDHPREVPGLKYLPVSCAPMPKLEDDAYDWYGRHQRVLAEQGAAEPDIVMIGDSITHRWAGLSSIGGDDARDAFKAAFKGHRVLNLGFGWDRTCNALWRLENGEMRGLKPRTIIIHIGGNNFYDTDHYRGDRPADVAEGVLAVVRKAHAMAPQAKIILMAIFPFGRTPSDLHRPKIPIANAILAAEATKLPYVTYLDITDKQLDADGTYPASLAADAIHPTDAGYQIWADALAPHIK